MTIKHKRIIETSDIGRKVTAYLKDYGKYVTGIVVDVQQCYRIRTGPDSETRIAFGYIAITEWHN